MATLTEGVHSAGFIVSESNGTRTRDAIIVKQGNTLIAGQLYSLDDNEKAIPYEDGATVAGISLGNYDATDADTAGVGVVRDCEVKKIELLVFDGADDAQKQTAYTAIESLGIIAR